MVLQVLLALKEIAVTWSNNLIGFLTCIELLCGSGFGHGDSCIGHILFSLYVFSFIFKELELFFAKVASISWGRCKVKNKGDSKPEKSQGPVLQRYIRSTSLRFPSDSKADDWKEEQERFKEVDWKNLSASLQQMHHPIKRKRAYHRQPDRMQPTHRNFFRLHLHIRKHDGQVEQPSDDNVNRPQCD